VFEADGRVIRRASPPSPPAVESSALLAKQAEEAGLAGAVLPPTWPLDRCASDRAERQGSGWGGGGVPAFPSPLPLLGTAGIVTAAAPAAGLDRRTVLAAKPACFAAPSRNFP